VLIQAAGALFIAESSIPTDIVARKVIVKCDHRLTILLV